VKTAVDPNFDLDGDEHLDVDSTVFQQTVAGLTELVVTAVHNAFVTAGASVVQEHDMRNPAPPNESTEAKAARLKVRTNILTRMLLMTKQRAASVEGAMKSVIAVVLAMLKQSEEYICEHIGWAGGWADTARAHEVIGYENRRDPATNGTVTFKPGVIPSMNMNAALSAHEATLSIMANRCAPSGDGNDVAKPPTEVERVSRLVHPEPMTLQEIRLRPRSRPSSCWSQSQTVVVVVAWPLSIRGFRPLGSFRRARHTLCALRGCCRWKALPGLSTV
jgi:hypothetical protein